MANSILIIGGSAHLKGMIDELEDRLINKISHYDSEIERVEVIDMTQKDILPINLSWVKIIQINNYFKLGLTGNWVLRAYIT
jgi:hypothetical protein